MSVLSMAAGAAAVPANAAAPSPQFTCDSQTPGGDKLEIRCPMLATGAPQAWLFRANFSGGHDDTIASLSAMLNEQPLECAVGSKTRLMGEDGDVFLECRLVLSATAGVRQLLQVTLLWSHAQFTNFELTAQ